LGLRFAAYLQITLRNRLAHSRKLAPRFGRTAVRLLATRLGGAAGILQACGHLALGLKLLASGRLAFSGFCLGLTIGEVALFCGSTQSRKLPLRFSEAARRLLEAGLDRPSGGLVACDLRFQTRSLIASRLGFAFNLWLALLGGVLQRCQLSPRFGSATSRFLATRLGGASGILQACSHLALGHKLLASGRLAFSGFALGLAIGAPALLQSFPQRRQLVLGLGGAANGFLALRLGLAAGGLLMGGIRLEPQ